MTDLGVFAASAYQALGSLNKVHAASAVIESSHDAIITKAFEWHHYQLGHLGAEHIFGYKPERMVGKPITILIPPDHINEEPAILERIRTR